MERTTQIIVYFRPGFALPDEAGAAIRAQAALSAAAGVRLEAVRSMSGGGTVFRLPGPLPIDEVERITRKLAQRREVRIAEVDRRMHPLLVPNDPRFDEQWHYFEPDGGLGLPAAWDLTTGSSSVVVASIDTGIRPHQDFGSRILPGYDFVSDDQVANDGDGRDSDARDPGDWITAAESASGFFEGCSVTDSSWHGTHTSGTMTAGGNNGIGVAGVSWQSRLLPVRVLGKCGGFISDIADGMRWAAGLPVSGVATNSNPARIINVSLGGSGNCSQTYQMALADIFATGGTVVVAAGNGNEDASNSQPANCDGVFTVAANNREGDKAFYSNFGSIVSVSAPGGESSFIQQNGVLSTLNTGQRSPGSDNYEFYQGTSMAAPHVSGVIALMLARRPSLTRPEILAILTSTARSFAPGSGCVLFGCGAGIVDAAAAVAAAGTEPTPTRTFTPGATETPRATSTPAPAGAPRFPSLAAHGFEGLDEAWREGLGGHPAAYRIYVSDGIGPFSSVLDVPGDRTTHNHAKMGAGSYYFRVTGVNGLGESAPSKQVHAILDGLSPGGAQSRTFVNEMFQDLRIRLWAFEGQSPAFHAPGAKAAVPGFDFGMPKLRPVPEQASSATRLGGVPFALLASGSDRSQLAGAGVPEPEREPGHRIGDKPRVSAVSAAPAPRGSFDKAAVSREEETVYNFDPDIEGDELVYVTGFTAGDRIASKIVPRPDAYPLEVRSGFLYLHNALNPASPGFTGFMRLWADDNGGLPGTQLDVEALDAGDIFFDPLLGSYYVTKTFAGPRPRIEAGSFFISVEWTNLDFNQNPVQENAMAGHTSTGRSFRYSPILSSWQNWDDVLGFLATDWLEGVSIEPNLPGTGPTPTPAQATKTPTRTRTPTRTETPRPVTPGACNVVVEVRRPGGALAGTLAAGFDETAELQVKAAGPGEFQYAIHTAGNCNGTVNYVVTSGPSFVLGDPTSPVPPAVAVLSVLLLASRRRRRRKSS